MGSAPNGAVPPGAGQPAGPPGSYRGGHPPGVVAPQRPAAPYGAAPGFSSGAPGYGGGGPRGAAPGPRPQGSSAGGSFSPGSPAGYGAPRPAGSGGFGPPLAGALQRELQVLVFCDLIPVKRQTS